ncbi:MAG TPA: hypothetical protein VEP90_10405 [Methylomirabilota bacterium]|nr:hypothetical protein [Methylomirabilota bacterium]
MIDLNIEKKYLWTQYLRGKAWGAEITTLHVIDPECGVPGARLKKRKEREEDAKREAETLVLNAIDPLIRKDRVNIKKEVVENLILLRNQ